MMSEKISVAYERKEERVSVPRRPVTSRRNTFEIPRHWDRSRPIAALKSVAEPSYTPRSRYEAELFVFRDAKETTLGEVVKKVWRGPVGKTLRYGAAAAVLIGIALAL